MNNSNKSKTLMLSKGMVAIVDENDLKKIKKYKWHYDGLYAERNIYSGKSRKTERLHRFILGLGQGDKRQIDHINGNKLDNRKENLRICTISQNTMNRPIQKNNTSGFKGVSHCGRGKSWRAYIKLMQKYIHIGYFKSKIEAAKAYNEAAKKYFGEFAQLNKI
jgi:hypothetical protein